LQTLDDDRHGYAQQNATEARRINAPSGAIDSVGLSLHFVLVGVSLL
jgi:hypothetical protein